MTEYTFTILIERQPEGEYLVSVPALPGCYTQGSTLEEARRMAEDALFRHIAPACANMASQSLSNDQPSNSSVN